MIKRRLDVDISEEQLAATIELARRLARFGYTKEEVIEHTLFHGGKVMERVAAGHEAERERARRVTQKIAAG